MISTQTYTDPPIPTIDPTLASIVHELNNPLTTILGLSELLLEANPKLTRIRAEAQRSVRIIRNILDLARAESPSSFDGRTAVDLNEAIRHSTALVEDQLEAHSIELTVELPWRSPMVHSRSGELTQVFLNLITNAIQAIASAGRPGSITITGNQLGNRVCITVEDDGPGLTDAAFSRLFQPYFTTKGEGTGMGLHLSRKIIQNIEGELWASRNLDRGAIFTVELPVLDAPAERLRVV
jgi:signal transduction histidine kinase